MLFFAAIKKAAFSMTGDLGSYTGTGTTATSTSLTAVGAANITPTVSFNDTGGAPEYKISAGAWTSIAGLPVAITNGQTLDVRITGMVSSAEAEIIVYGPLGEVIDSYYVTKL